MGRRISSTGSLTSWRSRERVASSSSTAAARTVSWAGSRYGTRVNADALLERLAAEHRRRERVCLISSDSTLRGTAGHEVEQRSSAGFLADFERPQHEERASSRVGDRVDEETRAALERLRRGEKP